VETVAQAIIALGLKRVQSIVLSCALTHVLPTDKWALDAITFWRHSLACALVSRKMARLIGYQDPEKAYLAGLLHDLGILVNSLVCTEEFRRCLQHASASCSSIDKAEKQYLGFTHCESGKILAEHWHIPTDLAEGIECHHGVESSQNARALVALVHLSDLLCRVREFGYGYYEVMGVDFAGDAAWSILVENYPRLREVDLARLSLDVEAAMGEIAALVDAVFAVNK
jgi:putative nucleotidyltransferase with HDIG domain